MHAATTMVGTKYPAHQMQVNPVRRSIAFRAGTIPGPVSTEFERSAFCPDDLLGFLHDQKACKRGLHGLHLIIEEESLLLGLDAVTVHGPNILRARFRRPEQDNLGQLHHTDGPGVQSGAGPRHDNDFADVQDIRILPTTDEILAPRLPYLPVKQSSERLDFDQREERYKEHCANQFRHLRYEFTEPIIDAVYLSIQHLVAGRLRNVPRDYTYHHQTAQGTGFNYFHGLEFEDMSFHEQNGIQMRCSFNCPKALRGDNMRKSNVLENGMLCAIVSVNMLTGELYSVILETISRHSSWGMKHKTGNDTRAAVIFKLAMPEDINKARELVWMAKKAPAVSMRFALVDLSGVLLVGTLHHLQRLKALAADDGDVLPFMEKLSCHKTFDERVLAVHPPQYSQTDGFQWNLKGLRSDPADTEKFFLDTANREGALNQMSSRTTLDIGQAGALFDILTRELAFTQGPPGTGKSFLGIATVKVLVDSVSVTARGPILVVAQTNHALDELLEGLKAKGITEMVRVGSRCKSKDLEKEMLRNLREKRKETCQEGNRRAAATKRGKRYLHDGVAFCEVLSETDHVLNAFRDLNINPNYTIASDSSMHSADEEEESPGFTDNPNSRRRAEVKSQKDEMRKFARSLPVAEQCDMLVELHRRHQLSQDAVSAARRLKNLNIMKTRDIIGLTTSACAREVELIKQLQPKILVIEEASEVLEAHSICALVPSIQHCINIGDPLQLRPHITSKVLDTEHREEYRLNEPLFERLIKAGLPYAKLSVQRRAHPDLSVLIQKTDYDYVTNHESTRDRAPVRGMTSRLQWAYHAFPEKLVQPEEGLACESWANDYEAHMVVSMAMMFVKGHGYGPREVAIITPYNGQLALVAKLLAAKEIKVSVSKEDKEALVSGGYMSRHNLGPAEEAEGTEVDLADMVRIATLDNFQGEEAKIVILTTVRSNGQNKIGFLKNSNRINVAVSRAKEGFYIVGDAELLRRNSPHWAKLVAVFIKQRALNKGFLVPCRHHPNQRTLVSTVKEAEAAADWITHGCSLCAKW